MICSKYKLAKVGYHNSGCGYHLTYLQAALFLVINSLLISPLLVEAQEFGFQPRIITGIMHYKYGNPDVWEMSDNQPFLGIGGTFTHDRLFIDAYSQKSAEGEDEGAAKQEPKKIYDATFERRDHALTLGYAVNNNLSFFAGYKYGKSENTFQSQFASERLEHHFRAQGPFIGAAYGWQLGRGLLAVNLAIAKLEGQSTVLGFNTNDDVSIINKTFASADTLGWTLGVNWNAPLTKNITYSVSLDGYKYTYETYETWQYIYPTKSGGQVDDIDIEETMYSIKASLIYHF